MPKKYTKQDNEVYKVPSQGTPHHVQSHDSGSFSQGSDYIPPNQEAFAQAEEQNSGGSLDTDVEMASGTTSRGGSGGVAEPGGTGISRLLIGGDNGVNKGKHTFNRSFEVNTINYANANIRTTVLPASHRMGNTFNLITPLAVINPNNLQLYCNQEEWDELPKTTWAKRCRISCTPLSYRTSFETASTNVGAANSQMPVNIEYAVGLNKYLVHGVAPITATNMVPTNTVAYSGADDSGLWGKFLNGIRTLQSPAMASYSYFPNNNEKLFATDLSKYVVKENLITAKGHKVIDYEYNFKVAPMKNIKSPYGLYNGTYNRFPLAQQTQPLLMSSITENPNNEGYLSTNSETIFTYNNGLEKAQFMTMEVENNHTSDVVPFIYFGGQAVLSSMPGADSPTFSNVYVQWKIDVSLDVEWNINFSDLTLKLLPHFTPMYARVLEGRLNTMHAWDSAGHQMAFVGGRFYNSNTTAVKVTPATRDGKENEVKKRVVRQLLPDLECEESISDVDDSQPVTKMPRKPYKGVLKENEGVFELYDM